MHTEKGGDAMEGKYRYLHRFEKKRDIEIE